MLLVVIPEVITTPCLHDNHNLAFPCHSIFLLEISKQIHTPTGQPMSATKTVLVAAAALMLASTGAEITPVPPEQHDLSKATFTRYCEYKISHGGHALCSEYDESHPTVAWYRSKIQEIYKNPNLTPEQKSAMTKPLADKYLQLVQRSNWLMDTIAKEQYDEFAEYCFTRATEPVCRNKFDRSLYAEAQLDEDFLVFSPEVQNQPVKIATKKMIKKVATKSSKLQQLIREIEDFE